MSASATLAFISVSLRKRAPVGEAQAADAHDEAVPHRDDDPRQWVTRQGVRLERRFGLVIVETPLPLKPYALSLLWHPRQDTSAEHGWLRRLFVEAAREVAPDLHPRAKTSTTDGRQLRRMKRDNAPDEVE